MCGLTYEDLKRLWNERDMNSNMIIQVCPNWEDTKPNEKVLSFREKEKLLPKWAKRK